MKTSYDGSLALRLESVEGLADYSLNNMEEYPHDAISWRT
jgi:hypothetical protein